MLAVCADDVAMPILGATVRVNCWLTGASLPEPATCTVKFCEVALALTFPEITPPELRERPEGSEPDVRLHEYAPDPPWAVSVLL